MARGRRKPKPQLNGEVYLLLIELDGTSVIKIGTTNRSALKRMLEIAEVIHASYKFIPKMQILANERIHNNYVVEAALLEKLKKYRYNPLIEFEGCSELVKCDITEVMLSYRECMNADYKPTPIKLIEI